MAKRGENIRKRKDGRWEGRYPKGTDSNGKTVYGSVYAKTYREVKSKRQEKLLQISVAAPVCTDTLLQDAAALWLEHNRIRLKGATVYRYRNLLDNHVLPDLGHLRLDRLHTGTINAYLADKLTSGRLDGHGGLSPAYVRSIALVINAIVRYGIETGLCAPMRAKIQKPSIPRRELPILTPQSQKALEALCLQKTDGTKAGILLSLYAGLRIGEVCALAWQDLDLQQGVIHIRKTVSRHSSTSPGRRTMLVLCDPKTATSHRDIPISSWLIPVLKQLRSRNGTGFMASACSDFLSPRTYDYRYHKLLSAAGIPPVNYHALRHTFATRCVESGMDIKTLSEILGHADAAVTLNTYVHSSMERKRLHLEKLRL